MVSRYIQSRPMAGEARGPTSRAQIIITRLWKQSCTRKLLMVSNYYFDYYLI